MVKRSTLPVRKVYEGMVPGNGRRGRPKCIWRDDIADLTILTWNELNKVTKDRGRWRGLVKSIV